MKLATKRIFCALAAFAFFGLAACASAPDAPRDPDALPGHGADRDWKGIVPPPADPKQGHPLGVTGSFSQHTQRESGRDIHPTLFRRGRVIELYFSSDRDGNGFDVYRKLPSGNAMTKITTASGDEFWPTVSPNGRYLAYGSNVAGNWDIYVMSLQDWGATPQLLTAGSSGDDIHPTWSPDGSRLVYASYSDQVGSYILRYIKFEEVNGVMSSGSAESTLAFAELPGSTGTGAPSTSAGVTTSGILEVVETGVLVSHQGTHITGMHPVFRPGADRLELCYREFNRQGKGWADLKIFNLMDGGIRIVPVEGFGIVHTSWSPDGEQLVFTGVSRAENPQIASGGAVFVVSDPDGSSLRVIANPTDQRSVNTPIWLNDLGENRLYFSAADATSEYIASIRIGGR